jgi:ribosomal protein L7/L12
MALARGNKIEAIRLVRRESGLGLKEANGGDGR